MDQKWANPKGSQPRQSRQFRLVPYSVGIIMLGFVASPSGQLYFYDATKESQLVQSLRAKTTRNLTRDLADQTEALHARSLEMGSKVQAWVNTRAMLMEKIDEQTQSTTTATSLLGAQLEARQKLEDFDREVVSILQQTNDISRQYKQEVCKLFFGMETELRRR